MQEASSLDNNLENFDTLSESPFTNNIVNITAPYQPVIEGLSSINDFHELDIQGDPFNFELDENELLQTTSKEPYVEKQEENSTIINMVPENETNDIFKATVNTLNGVGMDRVLNEIISGKNEEAKKYNKIKEHNEKRIMDIMGKHDLPYDSINGILKMNEAYIENLNFHLSLRKAINAFPIKSKVMDLLGIRKSYTGFHDFIKGDRPDLPEVGLNSIATKMGYSIALVPIKNINEDSENIPKDYLIQQDVIAKAQEYFVGEVAKVLEANLKEDLNKKKSKEKVQPEQAKNIMDFMSKSNVDDILSPMSFEDSSMFEDSEIFQNDDLEDLIEEDNLDEFKDFQGSFNLDDFPDSQTLNGKEFENSYFDGSDDPNNLDQTMKKDDGDFDDFDDSFDPEEFQKIEFDKEKK